VSEQSIVALTLCWKSAQVCDSEETSPLLHSLQTCQMEKNCRLSVNSLTADMPTEKNCCLSVKSLLGCRCFLTRDDVESGEWSG